VGKGKGVAMMIGGDTVPGGGVGGNVGGFTGLPVTGEFWPGAGRLL